MASFQLLDNTNIVGAYPDEYLMNVFPAIAVKDILGYSEEASDTTLNVAATSNVHVAAASNVNLFFNDTFSLFAPPSGVRADAGQIIDTLLLKVSQDADTTFARIDAGQGRSLLLSGTDEHSQTQVSQVLFSDDGAQSILETARNNFLVKDPTTFQKSVAVGGSLVASGNVFGNTLSTYRDIPTSGANVAVNRVAYTFMISDAGQLQLVKSCTFNDSNETTVSQMTTVFGFSLPVITASNSVSNVPLVTGGTSSDPPALRVNPWAQDGSNLSYVSGPVTIKTLVGDSATFSNVTSSNVYAVSDERKKNVVGKVEGALAKVCKVDGVYFNWKDDGTLARNIGVIAQQVEPIFPELVTEVDAIKTVNYAGFVPVLIEALKELVELSRTGEKGACQQCAC